MCMYVCMFVCMYVSILMLFFLVMEGKDSAHHAVLSFVLACTYLFNMHS